MGPLIGQGTISAMQFGLLRLFLPYFQEDMNRKPTLKEIWIAGTFTGAFMWIPVTPIEGIKARLQVQYSEKHTGQKAQYSGTPDAYKKVYRDWGIKGLYKGGIPTFFQRLSFGWYMWGYEGARRFLTRNQESTNLSPISTLAAGVAAGTVFWFSNYPFDVLKNRIQASRDCNPPVYKNMVDCAQQIYAKDGLKGFYRGFSVCLVRSAPANATTFLFLEMARRVLPE